MSGIQMMILASGKGFSVDYPTSINGFASGMAPAGNVSTGTSWSVPTFSGGSGSYSYSWAYLSGDSGINIAGPTTQRPNFSAVCADGVTRSATFRCTVTDTVSGAVATDDMTVYLDWADTT